ncbi:Transposase [Abditibacterium utsteinense]|uniref:Transposase n=1 Tax=Abditibacterium utsteinense TaxID=1960156 RepID=A0A2S8SU45_9BACT|nr:Transposase [Abditibacterium utsteinense]
MVNVLCVHCGSKKLIKNGLSRGKKQQYVCRSCGRSSVEHPQKPGHSDEFKSQILALYFERPSMRGIQRATGVSRQTLSKWLKKRHADEARKPALSGANASASPER